MSGDSEELKREIELLSSKVEKLEQVINNLFVTFGRLGDFGEKYAYLIGLYLKYGEISPNIALPGVKDPISKEIIRALFEKSDLNISQITGRVRGKRGSASRRIIKERLDKLEEGGIVVKDVMRKSKNYKLSPDVIKKCSKVLGFDI